MFRTETQKVNPVNASPTLPQHSSRSLVVPSTLQIETSPEITVAGNPQNNKHSKITRYIRVLKYCLIFIVSF